MMRLLTLLLGIVSITSGCGKDSANTPRVPDSYPVRQDYLVVAPPKATATKAYEPGYPPLKSLDLPDSQKDTDQKAFAAELESKNIVKCSSIGLEEKKAFEKGLTALFGTPASPKIEPLTTDVDNAAGDLKLSPNMLAAGGELFRKNCLQCHGLTGNGNGPVGAYLFPMPRDYRQGLFKFLTTEPNPEGTKPSRHDLFNTIWRGLPGSGMTSFSGLRPEEVESLISHVIYLAIRGEVEYQTMKMTIKFGLEAEDIESELKKQTQKIVKIWHDSQKRRIVPAPNPYVTEEQQLAAAAAGAKLFLDGQQGACTTCHVNYGRNALYQYDAWGTMVRPRNLTVATYRVSTAPEAIYARVYGGIQGSGMPSHAHLMPKPGDKDNKIWQLVYFVNAISNPDLRQRLMDEFQVNLD
ncbi:cytochrome c [Telmatocola sphagniphila]|uniref:Cytochrome c n=1 Tax=Telmatocola sphagniphila TaxID=1123043 RepID=A0A8E6BB17_9BACT|nr:cytochrome c [Telmatocola sphagniphila]QVL34637.1 cytochrome c [Telmatocola sphagniphila]